MKTYVLGGAALAVSLVTGLGVLSLKPSSASHAGASVLPSDEGLATAAPLYTSDAADDARDAYLSAAADAAAQMPDHQNSYRLVDPQGIETVCYIGSVNGRAYRSITRHLDRSIQTNNAPTDTDWRASGCEFEASPEAQQQRVAELQNQRVAVAEARAALNEGTSESWSSIYAQAEAAQERSGQ